MTIVRQHHYTGPSNTSDFDGLTPDQGAALAGAYRHLGDAFEDRCDDEMLGLGFHLDDPLGLLQYKSDEAARARRELVAAVRLARFQGQDWTDIGRTLGKTWVEVMRAFPEVRP